MKQNKKEISSLYKELLGYQSQTKELREDVRTTEIADQMNIVIEKLLLFTKDNEYTRFKISLKSHRMFPESTPIPYFDKVTYVSKLAGLIGRLESQFPDIVEKNTFSNGGITLNNSLSQNQTTQIYIEISTDLMLKIGEKLADPEVTAEEKSFLEKVKNGISSVKNYAELISLVVNTAASVGLAVDQLKKIFG